ncbi:MAG: hypothetical protein WCA11_15645 [Terracidiphilus sp.]
MKKNAIGILGIALAIVVALLMMTTKTASSVRHMLQLDGALIVIILGFVNAVRGSWLWLILSAVGLAEAAFIIF